MMEEIWKDIEGYEGKYQVSSLGRVRRLAYTFKRRNRWGVCDNVISAGMMSLRNVKGYLSVQLRDETKRKHHQVHRLVAAAFIPNPDGLPEVNHKNEDKTDNRVENLEWCTRKYNTNYGTRGIRIWTTRRSRNQE